MPSLAFKRSMHSTFKCNFLNNKKYVKLPYIPPTHTTAYLEVDELKRDILYSGYRPMSYPIGNFNSNTNTSYPNYHSYYDKSNATVTTTNISHPLNQNPSKNITERSTTATGKPIFQKLLHTIQALQKKDQQKKKDKSIGSLSTNTRNDGRAQLFDKIMKGGAQATGGIGTVGCSPLFKYSPQIPSSIMLVANNYHIVGAVSCMFMEYDPIWSKVDKNLIKKIKPYELIRNKYGTVFNKGLRKKRSTIMDLINENGGNTVPKLSSNKKVTKNSHELGEKTICSNTPNKNEKATAAAAATTEEEEIDQNIIYFLNHLKNSSTK